MYEQMNQPIKYRSPIQYVNLLSQLSDLLVLPICQKAISWPQQLINLKLWRTRWSSTFSFFRQLFWQYLNDDGSYVIIQDVKFSNIFTLQKIPTLFCQSLSNLTGVTTPELMSHKKA